MSTATIEISNNNSINLNRNLNSSGSSERSLSQDLKSLCTIFKNIHESATTTWKEYHQHSITKLNEAKVHLNKSFPNNPLQDKLDAMGHEIEELFAPLKEFNSWLNHNGHGDWYLQLATFLGKLPLCSARNIVQLQYNIIKGLTTSVVHPLRAPLNLAILVTNLVNELTQPETWSKMGAGMLGASIGQSVISGNPLSEIAVGISAAMIIGGISLGALKAALEAKEGHALKAVKDNLLSQGKTLPETLLTGVFMGGLIGGIQRVIQSYRLSAFRISSFDSAKQFADQFIEKHGLPQYSDLSFDPSSGNVVIRWANGNYYDLIDLQPQLAPSYSGYIIGGDYTLTITPTQSSGILSQIYYDWSYYEKCKVLMPAELNIPNFGGRLYPTPPPIAGIDALGPIAGATVEAQG